jgi:hypothetical protein
VDKSILTRLSLVLAVLLSVAAAAHAACRVEPQATVPLTLVSGHILVSVSVNDTDVTFILDTGAERTLMAEDVVRQLGMERDQWVASTVRGVGGLEERPNALPRSLRLGALTLRRKTLSSDNSVTVGPMPVSTVNGRQVAGLLGRDFLSPFDLDIDLPRRSLTLYTVAECTAAFLPWTTTYSAVPATTVLGNAMILPVQVDGHPMRALLDTGASSTLITAPGMFRLGVTPDMLAHDPVASATGIGPASVPMRLHQFAALRVGPDTTHAPRMWVSQVRVVPIVDMLLGADWLQNRRVWVSFATQQLFVSLAH